MNNTTNRLPTTEEVNQARNNPDKYMVVYNKAVPVAIYEIKRTRKLFKSPLMTTHADNKCHVHHIIAVSKHSSIRDDTWDNNYQD